MAFSEAQAESLGAGVDPIDAIQIGMNTLTMGENTNFDGMTPEELASAVEAVRPAVAEIIKQSNEGKPLFLHGEGISAGDSYV